MSDRRRHTKSQRKYEADVCLILEGCYPYVSGGVSSWTHALIQQQSGLSFSVISIVPQAGQMTPKYELPDNVVSHYDLSLHQPSRMSGKSLDPRAVDYLASLLLEITEDGNLSGFGELIAFVNDPKRQLQLNDLINSPLAWDVVRAMYNRMMPYASFLHYFWAWRSLFGGLFAILKFKLPAARAYHSISTGYAGLLVARAKLETGRPAIITEHGIYTNERRIEILMAEWIADTLDKGLSIADKKYDLRDMWTNTFEQYARICYRACDKILTLYEENQNYQLALDADRQRMAVIPNGIDLRRFQDLPRARPDARPTVALIGRVVPIKDIKTYINAVALVRNQIPDLRALVIGPTDEDPDYYCECEVLAHNLCLEDCVHFTGMVKVEEYLPQIHVHVLTSISEAQPLAVLEAGAAGVPSVATNVGSCQEILEGRSDERPKLGQGGIITDLVSPTDTARAIDTLLRDRETREFYGDTLKTRIALYYNSNEIREAYACLYRRYSEASSLQQALRSEGKLGWNWL
jgi:glycosyltransferase involved in cell wall biosynthesis